MQVEESNRSLKRFFIKTLLCHKEFVPYFVSSVLKWYQYSMLVLWPSQPLYLLLQVYLVKKEEKTLLFLCLLHQNMKGNWKMFKQASRWPSKLCWKGRWRIVCCRWKCCWSYFQFSCQSCWICSWKHMVFNCFCC